MANDDALLMDSTSYAPMVDFQVPDAPQPVQQPPESEQGFLNQFYGAIGKTIFQDNPRLSGRAIEGLGRVSGSESMKSFGEGIVADFDATPAQEVFVPRVSEPQDIDGISSAFDYLGSTLGQGLGSMAMTVGGAVAGAGVGAAAGSVVPGAGTVAGAAAGGATGGAVAGSFLLNYGDMYDYLVEQEGMEEDTAAHFALVPGSIMAGLDASGVGKLATAPFRKELSDKLRTRTVQLAAQGVATEGLTEAAQQLIQETAGEISEQLGYATEDIEFADRFKSIVNAFIAGGLTGGTVGGASAVLKRPAEAPTEAPPGDPDIEEDVPDAPQTAAEAGAPVEVMVEETAEPEVAAEPETEAEQSAEEEVQKEEDPEEPKSDLTLTSDGKFYSKVFKYLLNIPEGVGYDRPVLDEQGKPVQEQEVDENGDPVFLESGKPKMGPVQKQRVYKVSDLYAEDERGKASGALSRFPKGELELLGIHEHLIEKALDGPRRAMDAERARIEKELDSSRKALIDAANPLGLNEYVVPEMENQEFLDSMTPEDRDFYLEDRALDLKSKRAVGILENEITSIEFDGGDASAIKELLQKQKRAYSRFSDPLDPSEFVGAEAEITQDEINQYIADNQWRLDFGDVRRVTPEALTVSFEPSPELTAMIEQHNNQTSLTLDLERQAEIGATWDKVKQIITEESEGELSPEDIQSALYEIQNGGVAWNQSKSIWGQKGILRLDQDSVTFDPNLLHQITDSASSGFTYFGDRIDKAIALMQLDLNAYRSEDGGEAFYEADLTQTPMYKALKVASDGTNPLRNWSSSNPQAHGSTARLMDPGAGWSDTSETMLDQTLSELDSILEAHGGSERFQAIENEIQSWFRSKDPKWMDWLREKEQKQEREGRQHVYVPSPSGTVLGNLMNTMMYGTAPPSLFREKASEWAKEESIYSEQMPDRQKQLFSREFEKMMSLQKEHAMLRVIKKTIDNVKRIKGMVEEVAALQEAEAHPIVRKMRAEQRRSKKILGKLEQKRKEEMDAHGVGQSDDLLDYVVSRARDGRALELKHPNFSLLGGNESNKRQILIIDPSKEKRDYKASLADPGADESVSNQLKRLLYQAGHWGGDSERGAGVHIRVHDMTIMRDGQLLRILVIEEIQNDHAQDGRKYGSSLSEFRSNILRNRAEIIDERRNVILSLSRSDENPNAVNGNLVLVPSKDFPIRTSLEEKGSFKVEEKLIDPEHVDEWVQLSKERAKIESQLVIGDPSTRYRDIPQTVFGNTEEWTQAGMRKAFSVAMDEGYDGLAVIGGASAGPITFMDTVEQNLSHLARQVRDLEDADSFEIDGLLSKTVDPVWGDTVWSGVWADIMYTPRRADFQVNLNIDKLNQTIGLYDFLQEHKRESEYISGAKLKEFILNQDSYIGSSANTHYDVNVAKQGKIISGAEGVPAVGKNILRDVTGRPAFKLKEGETSTRDTILKGGSRGVQEYLKSPPKLWVFDEKMTKRLSGPQPIISPELKDIKGGWERSLKDLLNDERDKAEAKRKEGVVYFEDMTHQEHASIVKKIKESTENLPNLEYPFTASLGKAGGKAVEILGHVKGKTVSVKMSEDKTVNMPATNIFVGNDPLVEKDVQYLLDPKVAQRIRKDHAESIRKAMEEGHDIPQGSMDSNPEFGGGWGLEEDYEFEETPESIEDYEMDINAIFSRDIEKLSPHEMTKDEFELTATRLMHGTSRKFDRFDAATAKDRYHKAIGEERKRWYFTDKPDVANRFADHGGHQAVHLEEFAKSDGADLYYDYENYQDGVDEYYPLLVEALNKRIKGGKEKLYYVEYPPGSDDVILTEVNDAADISAEDYNEYSKVRLYKKGHYPRVIEANVYGRTLDLTDPNNIPEDLKDVLQGRGSGGYRPWISGHRGFQHEYAPNLIQYAREKGYGKIKVRDAYESGFESVIALEEFIEFGVNPHKAFIKKAMVEGKRVPPEVLEDYPDLKEMAYGKPPGPGETHGKFDFSAKDIDVSGPKTYIRGLIDEIAASGGWGLEEDYEIEEGPDETTEAKRAETPGKWDIEEEYNRVHHPEEPPWIEGGRPIAWEESWHGPETTRIIEWIKSKSTSPGTKALGDWALKELRLIHDDLAKGRISEHEAITKRNWVGGEFGVSLAEIQAEDTYEGLGGMSPYLLEDVEARIQRETPRGMSSYSQEDAEARRILSDRQEIARRLGYEVEED